MRASSGWHGAHGGRYTLLNRLRCWLGGHRHGETPDATDGRVAAFLCYRCNATALAQDVNSKLWYRSLHDCYAALDRNHDTSTLRNYL